MQIDFFVDVYEYADGNVDNGYTSAVQFVNVFQTQVFFMKPV
jgi:hypothetical protein